MRRRMRRAWDPDVVCVVWCGVLVAGCGAERFPRPYETYNTSVLSTNIFHASNKTASDPMPRQNSSVRAVLKNQLLSLHRTL